jgi:RHS repeat-associated protein
MSLRIASQVRLLSARRVLALVLILMLTTGTVAVPSVLARSSTPVVSSIMSALSAGMNLGWGSPALALFLNSARMDKPNKGMPAAVVGLPGLKPEQPLTKSEREAKVLNLEIAAAAELELGQHFLFTAIPLDAEGDAVHGLRAEWESADPNILTVAKDGQAIARQLGTAILTASVGLKKEKIQVTVVPRMSSRGTEQVGRVDGAKRNNPRSASLSPAVFTASRVKERKAERLEFRAHAVAAMFQSQQQELPNSELGSIYQVGNATGSPSGTTTPGAVTPPAAIGGTEMPGSSNFNFSLPVAGLPGRGLDASLSLTYNSRIWNKSAMAGGATRMYYDADKSWLSPGFNMGFGQIRDAAGVITLTDPDGTRHQMVSNPSSPANYDSNDGSFIHLYRTADEEGFVDNWLVTYPDGTQATYVPTALLSLNPGIRLGLAQQITDRNGNYILVSYLPGSYGNAKPWRISSIQDTLGRYIRFYYDSSKNLVAITAPGLSGQADLPVMRFYYQDITVNQSGLFQSGYTINAPSTAHVLKYIYLASATESGNSHLGYRFDYSAYGMIYQSVEFRGMTISTSSTDYTQLGTVTSEGAQSAITTYNYPTSASGLSDAPTYTQRTDDWAGRVSAQPVQYFSANQSTGVSTVTASDGTISETQTIVNPGQWDNGLISRSIIRNSTTTFSDTVYSWQQGYNSANPRISQIQITNDGGQTRVVVYSYDTNSNYNNVSAVSERDFASAGTQGTELRRTETSYINQTAYWNRGLLHLPTTTKVYGVVNGSMTLISQSDYSYDETTPTSYSDISTMMYSDPGTNVRGNLTKTRSYPDVTSLSTYIDHTASYDVAGNALTAQADCCQQKSFSYSNTFWYAYPTSVTSGSGPTLTSSGTYDFNTGLSASATDENSQVTAFYYNASSLRPEHVDYADGGAVYYQYNDALFTDGAGRQHYFINTSTRLDASRVVDSYQYFDGRGAVTQTFDGYTSTDGWSTRDVEYDVMGHAYRSSNPYYSGGYAAAQINPSGLWTASTFDNLGRVLQTTGPSGDSQNPTTRTAYAAYSGNQTLLTDPAGKQRLNKTNALNQLTDVWEITAADAATESVSFPNHSEVTAGYRSTYKYDALNNLVQVTQAIPNQTTQNRYFKYDSLGRLTFERQVEQDAPHNAADAVTGNNYWSRRYVYNSQSLIQDAYDARQINTHFAYDGLNRTSTISHSDWTPTITYTYDQARTGYFNQGRLTSVSTATINEWRPSTSQEYDYDKMGRTTAQRERIATTTYALSYSYNVGGLLLTETYPSGRVMNYAYDGAGRLSGITDGQAATYGSGFQYAPAGGLLSETFGNGAVHALSYNNALQPKQLKLTLAGTEQQRYDYLYGQVNQTTGSVDTAKNTGQLGRVDGFINTTKQWEQRLAYDSLSRLSQTAEYRGDNAAQTYQAHYDYDRYGNRFQSGSANFGLGFVPVVTSDIDPATNRFIQTGSTSITYDEAGNITGDGKFRNLYYGYDANNRVMTIDDPNEVVQVSSYDAAGQRVQTFAYSTTFRNTVYDVFGQPVADYTGSSGGTLERENIYRFGQLLATYETATSALNYVLTDAQGSTRAIMSNSGGNSAILARHDYLPFGEEIGSGTGQRTGGQGGQGYGAADTNRQKYGLTERDDPTGLDHTWFRKYDNTAGRWTTPDRYLGSMSPSSPQSFNRYAYVTNDPVNFIDPSGLEQCYLRIEVWTLGSRTSVKELGVWCEGNSFTPASYVTPFSGGAGRRPQKSDKEGLDRANKLLKGACKKFITSIITAIDPNLGASKDAGSLGLKAYKNLRKQGRVNAANVSGAYKGGTHIGGFVPATGDMRWYDEFYGLSVDNQAGNILHEGIHPLGNQFSDLALATAAYTLANGKAPPTNFFGNKPGQTDPSQYFNSQLFPACGLNWPP